MEYNRDRALQALGADIQEIIGQPGRANEKIQHIQERVLQLETFRADRKVICFSDQLRQRAEALQGDSPGRLDCGYLAIDHKTRGFYPGDLIVIGARPSMGKTSLGLNIAINVARAGTGVLFISLEMAAQQIQDRALCTLAGLCFSDIRHNPTLSGGDRRMLLDTAEKYERDRLPLFITTAGQTPAQQMVLLKQYRQIHQIGLVVIDYLQLMTADQPQQDQWHIGAQVSRDLKRMAQAEQIPVIVASQLSPESEGRKSTRPHLSDLRDAGSIDQDADVIMLLFREDYYRRQDLSYGTTETCEIDIAKQRNGPTGVVKLTFDKQTMTFQDYTTAY
jgi:replicative DNA helicase